MKTSRFDCLRLDVNALAKAAASLEGSWPLASLRRLAASAHPDTPPGDSDPVQWSARGERRERGGNVPEITLHLRARASLRLQCQRCLGPVDERVEVDRLLRFVPGEQQAAALDIDSEDDVLELTPALDLRELAEDELLLALPLVPRHERCPHPLVTGTLDDNVVVSAPPHPFAALQALKKPGGAH